MHSTYSSHGPARGSITLPPFSALARVGYETRVFLAWSSNPPLHPPATILTISKRSPAPSVRCVNSDGATASPLCSTTTLLGGRFCASRNSVMVQGRVAFTSRPFAVTDCCSITQAGRSGCPYHSCGISRITSAQSNVTLSGGNFV